MNYKVSIIVPVYNVELYLDKCLNSLINQTYGNIEIIVVNDGSTDNSSKIIDKYVHLDKRVILFNKKNGGLSSARNYAVKKATGDYLLFVDSDDWLEIDCVSYLVNCLKDKEYDIIEFGYQLVSEKDEIIKVYSFYNNLLENDNVLNSYFYNNIIPDIVCNKFYKKSLFNNVSFVEGKIHEDYMIMPELLSLCNSFYIIPNVFYNYLQRQGSITNNDFCIKNFDKLFAGKYVMDFCLKHAPDYVMASKIRYAFDCIFLYMHLNSSYLSLKEKSKYKEKIVNEFNQVFSVIKSCDDIKRISIVKRCFLKMFSLNKKVTCFIYKLLKR